MAQKLSSFQLTFDRFCGIHVRHWTYLVLIIQLTLAIWQSVYYLGITIAQFDAHDSKGYQVNLTKIYLQFPVMEIDPSICDCINAPNEGQNCPAMCYVQELQFPYRFVPVAPGIVLDYHEELEEQGYIDHTYWIKKFNATTSNSNETSIFDTINIPERIFQVKLFVQEIMRETAVVYSLNQRYFLMSDACVMLGWVIFTVIILLTVYGQWLVGLMLEFILTILFMVYFIFHQCFYVIYDPERVGWVFFPVDLVVLLIVAFCINKCRAWMKRRRKIVYWYNTFD